MHICVIFTIPIWWLSSPIVFWAVLLLDELSSISCLVFKKGGFMAKNDLLRWGYAHLKMPTIRLNKTKAHMSRLFIEILWLINGYVSGVTQCITRMWSQFVNISKARLADIGNILKAKSYHMGLNNIQEMVTQYLLS